MPSRATTSVDAPALRLATAALAEQDPRLEPVIRAVDLDPTTSSDPWWELVDSITSQQLSLKASATILTRVEALFPERPTPSELAGVDPERLRAAGLSWAKVRYVQDLAARVADGRLDLEALRQLNDEDVIATLTEVKGIGRWTAEMFLIFHLGRPDVLPVDDLGFREAAMRLYRLPERPDAETLTALGERWRPYRSVATRLLWKSLTLES
jgi:DNA-3-methyladenine glycosylase II